MKTMHKDKKADIPTRPSREILPQPRSNKRPCKADCTCNLCAQWRDIESMPCMHCGLTLKETGTFWFWIWRTGQVAHASCHDEYFELEKRWMWRDSVIEQAAKDLHIEKSNVVEGLPGYERERVCREALDKVFPDWRERIKNALQENRRGRIEHATREAA